jgi:hypothetical protein
MSRTRTDVVKPKSKARSRISNDSSNFLTTVDGRSVYARRFRDVTSQMASDLGGDLSDDPRPPCRYFGRLVRVD